MERLAFKSQCSINDRGSVERREKDGATEISVRSIETRGLVYNIFVGDGDTGTFVTVKEACFEKFGELYGIKKEECVGHIQKRMGKGLRQYKLKNKSIKLSDGKGVGGSGCLTDLIIDKMQNNFGEAIRNNIGNRDNMYNAIWAIFKHRVRNDVEMTLDMTYIQEMTGVPFGVALIKKHLPHVFVEQLKPIFTRLSEDKLLDRYLQGLTQNQNEAANQVLWGSAQKLNFVGKTRFCWQ